MKPILLPGLEESRIIWNDSFNYIQEYSLGNFKFVCASPSVLYSLYYKEDFLGYLRIDEIYGNSYYKFIYKYKDNEGLLKTKIISGNYYTHSFNTCVAYLLIKQMEEIIIT